MLPVVSRRCASKSKPGRREGQEHKSLRRFMKRVNMYVFGVGEVPTLINLEESLPSSLGLVLRGTGPLHAAGIVIPVRSNKHAGHGHALVTFTMLAIPNRRVTGTHAVSQQAAAPRRVRSPEPLARLSVVLLAMMIGNELLEAVLEGLGGP